jgi:hypothetical protein
VLAGATARMAVLVASGRAGVGAVPEPVAALAKGGLMSILVTKMRMVGLAIVTAATVAVGAGWYALEAQDRPGAAPDTRPRFGDPSLPGAASPPASGDRAEPSGPGQPPAAGRPAVEVGNYPTAGSEGNPDGGRAGAPEALDYPDLVARLARYAEQLQKKGDRDGAAKVLKLLEDVTRQWQASLAAPSGSRPGMGTPGLGRPTGPSDPGPMRPGGPPSRGGDPDSGARPGLPAGYPGSSPNPLAPLPGGAMPMTPGGPTGSRPGGAGDPNLEALRAVIDRLERIEKRLELMEKAPKRSPEAGREADKP